MGKIMPVVVAAVILCAGIALGAPPDTLWSNTFGGNFEDVCHVVKELPDGRFAMAGTTRSFGTGSPTYWLTLASESGDSLWSGTFGEGDCQSLAPTKEGGYALGGIHFVCVDRALGVRWDQAAGLTGHSMIQTRDSGFVAVGVVTVSQADTDVKLVRFNRDGELVWFRTFGGRNLEDGLSILEMEDGGFVFVGYETSFGADRDVWLVKTNSEGRPVWSRSYVRTGPDICYGLVRTDEGGFMLAGETTKRGQDTDLEFLLMKVDVNGNLDWTRTFGRNTRRESCYSIAKTFDGGYILGGTVFNPGNRDNNMLVVRVDAYGDSLWSVGIGGDGRENCFSVIQTSDSGYALAGSTYIRGSGRGDYWLVKLASEYDNAVSPEKGMPPLGFILTSPYPNPFNGTVNLTIQSRRSGEYSLTMIDPSGREVGRLLDGIVPAGENRVTWNATGIAAGQYYMRLTDRQGGSMVRSVVLVR